MSCRHGGGRARQHGFRSAASQFRTEQSAGADRTDTAGHIVLHLWPAQQVLLISPLAVNVLYYQHLLTVSFGGIFEGMLSLCIYIVFKMSSNRFRVFCHWLCNHSHFGNIILVCIMFSSAMLAAEDPLISDSPRNKVGGCVI